MKKLFVISFAMLCGIAAIAQEETPAKFKLYGFIRNYTILDTREVSAGTHDLYFYMPKDKAVDDIASGVDLNEGLNWKSVSLTTRLGLDMSGYQFGSMHASGKVEADFYSLNGTTGASTIAQLRLRQAYVGLKWIPSDSESFLLNIGQTWHPMGADMPHMTNLESGAPFNPFNRSPQIMAHWTKGDFTLTGGFLYLSQYLPMDAQAGAKSVNPYKYGLPESYLGVAYKKGPFVAKVGANLIATKPIRTYLTDGGTTAKAHGLLVAPSVFGFAQYTNGLFQLRVKSIYANSSEHLNLLSGYGVAGYTDEADGRHYTYTPMRDWASFISAQYGKKVQVMGMLGYMKQLGTTVDLPDVSQLWLNTAAATNIQQAFRATPTIAWNIGKLTISLEYNLTAAEFGSRDALTGKVVARNARGLYDEGKTHWVINHRFINMVKFNF
ncbi:MAG: hypothetical protein J6X25_05900 [Bacteroidales bacterium]|nr:hypothetical protein [Bacteroidales bacterium]